MKIKQVMILLTQDDYNLLIDAATLEERKKAAPASRISLRDYIVTTAVTQAQLSVKKAKANVA